MTITQPSVNKQSVWLWVALTITVALTAWTAFQPSEENASDDLVVPTINQRNANAITRAETPQPVSTERITANQTTWQISHREPLTEKPKDLFPVHSWVVMAPTIKTKPAPPPPPVAPPTPFTYLGKMEDGPKGTLIFLMANNKVYSVAKGDQVDAFWRLEGEDANQLMFTFLPLNLPQTLSKTQPLMTPDLPNAAVGAINE
jgi:hypothetical protein